MSKSLSLKLQDDIFIETEDIVDKIHIPRNAYINQAIEFFNKLNKRRLLKSKLRKESKLVSDESLLVLQEFEKFEEDYE
jgi:predicted transcriptional regulator